MKTLIILLVASVGCFAQAYPRWFLEPVNLGCASTSSGYAKNFFHQRSSDSAAYLKACENLARQRWTEFRGGESYWETEAGVYWMGNDFTEKIDSAYLDDIKSHANQLDVYSAGKVTIVLVSNGNCTISDSMLSVVGCSRQQPAWIEAVPQSIGYLYAEGVAPEYFYESSSWEAAERRARFNLARSTKVSLKAMQKVDESSGQQIRNEEVSVTLRDIEVVYRWRDAGRRLYFVLMRMPTK